LDQGRSDFGEQRLNFFSKGKKGNLNSLRLKIDNRKVGAILQSIFKFCRFLCAISAVLQALTDGFDAAQTATAHFQD
jgi:hypothetical protein